MTSRRALAISTSIAALCMLAIITIYLPYWRPNYWSSLRELKEIKDALSAEGQPIVLADVEPRTGEQVAKANRIASLMATLEDLDWDAYDAVLAAPPLSERNIESLRVALNANRAVLDELATLDTSDCQIAYDFLIDDPSGTLLTEASDTVEWSRLVHAEALLAILDNDRQSALEEILELAEITEFLSQDPFFVSHSIRAKNGLRVVRASERWLCTFDLSPEDFRRLDETLQELEANFRLRDVVCFERAFLMTLLDNPRLIGPWFEFGERADWERKKIPFGWYSKGFSVWSSPAYAPKLMQQQAWALSKMTRVSELIDETGTKATQDWQELEASLDHYVEQHRLTPVGAAFPSTHWMRKRALTYRQHLIAARLALRVVRHRQRTGKFPATLDSALEEGANLEVTSLWDQQQPKYFVEGNSFSIEYVVPDQRVENQPQIRVTLPSE